NDSASTNPCLPRRHPCVGAIGTWRRAGRWGRGRFRRANPCSSRPLAAREGLDPGRRPSGCGSRRSLASAWGGEGLHHPPVLAEEHVVLALAPDFLAIEAPLGEGEDVEPVAVERELVPGDELGFGVQASAEMVGRLDQLAAGPAALVPF